MQRQLTTPYSTPQNGIIKSRNQMVVQAAHQMLKAKDLSGTFWGGGEAFMMAMYILNWLTSRGADGKTSYELWTGSIPPVQHMRTFGCTVHVKNMRPHL
jgi:glutamate/tyrosine decarboxylase-like PLP-dependent enzyme